MTSEWTKKCFAFRKKNGETLADMLEPALQIDPNRIALYYEGQEITFGELDQAANRVANGLINLGVKPGSHVCIHVDNRPEFIYIFFGVMRAGCVLVPTNVMYTAYEMKHIIEDSGAAALFVIGPLAAKLKGILPELPTLKHVIEVGTPELEGSLDFASFCENSTTDRPDTSASPDDTAIIQYTSGTTGKPKGAMVSHANILAVLDSVSNLDEGPIVLQDDDVSVLVLPLFHAYALDLCLGLSLIHATSLVLMNRFDTEEVFASFERYKVTLFSGAPPMF